MPNTDGTYGEPVEMLMPAHDHAFLTGMWRQVQRAPKGGTRRGLVNELEVHLALHACFPGGHYVIGESAEPVQPVPLEWRLRAGHDDDQEEEAIDDPQPSLFA